MVKRLFSSMSVWLVRFLAVLVRRPRGELPRWRARRRSIRRHVLGSDRFAVVYAAGDSNWYTMMPGESPDTFNGSGWTLTVGRNSHDAAAGGRTGSVLNLPSGAEAVSPTVCVNSDYPTARTMVRDVAGAEGVQFYVSYEAQRRGPARKTRARSTVSTATGRRQIRSTSNRAIRPAGSSRGSPSFLVANRATSRSTTFT